MGQMKKLAEMTAAELETYCRASWRKWEKSIKSTSLK